MTTCRRGHEFTPQNTYINPAGARVCRTCKGIRARRYKGATPAHWDRVDGSLIDRIKAHVHVEDRGYETPCWVSDYTQTHDGYARIGIGRTMRYVHRVSYELHVGLVPEGLQLDHLCRIRACCNPDHLEPVTSAENHRRARQAALR